MTRALSAERGSASWGLIHQHPKTYGQLGIQLIHGPRGNTYTTVTGRINGNRNISMNGDTPYTYAGLYSHPSSLSLHLGIFLRTLKLPEGVLSPYRPVDTGTTRTTSPLSTKNST